MQLRIAIYLPLIVSWACSRSDERAHPAPDWQKVPVSLELRLAESTPAPGLAAAVVYGQPDTLYLHPEPRVTQSDIARVEAAKTMAGKGLVLAVWFTKAGARQLADMTSQHVGDTMAVLINSVLVAAPVIQETLGSDPNLPNHIGIPLGRAEAGQLAAAVAKTWPAAPAPSRRKPGKEGG